MLTTTLGRDGWGEIKSRRMEDSNEGRERERQENWYDEGNVLSGQREFLVQDPDGYLLRFTQYLGEKSK